MAFGQFSRLRIVKEGEMTLVMPLAASLVHVAAVKKNMSGKD
jgi:hypothetical protein